MANNHIETKISSNKILYSQHYGFQHVYLEYYAFIQDLNEQQVSLLLHNGLVSNLNAAKFNSETLQTLSTEITDISKNIIAQKQEFKKGFSQFHSSPAIKSTHNAIRLHGLLQESLNTKQITTNIEILKEELIHQLKETHNNYWIEFDLAWMYFHIYNDMPKAEHHFTQAADNCILDESVLAAISLRYLGYTKLMLNKPSEALSVMASVTAQYPIDTPQQLFESVQFSSHFEPHKQIKALKKAIEKSALYYCQLQSDALLGKHPSIQALLSAFHAAKLTQIQEVAQYKWKNSAIYQHKNLPLEFDKQGLFNDTFRQFKILLIHQPYPLLCKTEGISEKILASLSLRANKELDMAKTNYVKKIIHINKKWNFINRIGANLVYTATLFSLASIFLFITSSLFGIAIPMPTTGWKNLLSFFFSSIIVAGLLGILLVQFTPSASKKLSRKKAAITDALDPKFNW